MLVLMIVLPIYFMRIIEILHSFSFKFLYGKFVRNNHYYQSTDISVNKYFYIGKTNDTQYKDVSDRGLYSIRSAR